MESPLEMSALTLIITAASLGLFPLKSKPVQAIIMSMSWLGQLSVMQHIVQVIIFTSALFFRIVMVFVSVSVPVFKDEEKSQFQG